MRISDCSSDVCSSDLRFQRAEPLTRPVGVGRQAEVERHHVGLLGTQHLDRGIMVARDEHAIILIGPFELSLQPGVVLDHQQCAQSGPALVHVIRSEEHTSELQSLMRISYAVFCLKKKKNIHIQNVYKPQVILYTRTY